MRLQFHLFVLEVILRHFSRDRGFLTQRASFTITTATPRRQKSSRLRGFLGYGPTISLYQAVSLTQISL